MASTYRVPAPKAPLSWAAAAKLGDNLFTAMHFGEADVPNILGQSRGQQSTFVKLSDLAVYGWSSEHPSRKFVANRVGHIEAFYQININSENVIEWIQSGAGTVGNLAFTGTWGRFENIYNVEKNIICALQCNSPAQKESDSKLCGDDPLKIAPKLRHWSDVTFIQWSSLANNNPGGLKYIWRYQIQNEDTIGIIEKALISCFDSANILTPSDAAAAGFAPSDVPALTSDVWSRHITCSDREFTALLSTPHGCGVSLFLIQHKKQLGQKKIGGIRIFQETTENNIYRSRYYHIVFELEDAVTLSISSPVVSDVEDSITESVPDPVAGARMESKRRARKDGKSDKKCGVQ